MANTSLAASLRTDGLQMPNYNKKIVCLANSRKMSGRCIAGKEYGDEGVGDWVRPVSGRPHEEINEADRRYSDGTRAKLLDIVSIPMDAPKPHAYQSENHLIDDQYYWERTGRADEALIASAVDVSIDTLWGTDCSSYSGTNDRIPLEVAKKECESSLALIAVENVEVLASAEGAAFGDNKRKVRASFEWNGHNYALRVTDPEIEQIALGEPEKSLELGSAYLCISLGEPFNEYVYKLAAAVITQSRFD